MELDDHVLYPSSLKQLSRRSNGEYSSCKKDDLQSSRLRGKFSAGLDRRGSRLRKPCGVVWRHNKAVSTRTIPIDAIATLFTPLTSVMLVFTIPAFISSYLIFLSISASFLTAWWALDEWTAIPHLVKLPRITPQSTIDSIGCPSESAGIRYRGPEVRDSVVEITDCYCDKSQARCDRGKLKGIM